MHDVTRYGRVQPSVAPLRSTDGTHVSSHAVAHRVREVDLRASQRAMASAVREERRPGLFLFAHHLDYGLVGRLWLAADDAPRAGTLGRHDAVDLALPLDDALSLRHALFIVRLAKGQVRLTVLDLASSAGLQVGGPPLRRLDVTGPLALELSGFEVLCVPTGVPLPWDAEAEHPFATLRFAAPTLTRLRERTPPRSRRLRQVAGCLSVTLGERRTERAVLEDDLERGVLLGRDGRCDLRLPDGRISRVHAALLRVDGELLLVDAGSTNGLWRPSAEQIRCLAWGAGDPVELWEVARLEWSDAH